jgi:hypothetical protein
LRLRKGKCPSPAGQKIAGQRNNNMIKIITQCCVCGQTKDSNGIYDGIKKEVIRVGNVSHGYCPECFKKVMDEIKNAVC